MEMVGRAAHGQPMERLPTSRSVEQHHPVEHVRIEQVRERADGVGEVDEPVPEGPRSDILGKIVAEGEVRRCADLDRRLDLARQVFLREGS